MMMRPMRCGSRGRGSIRSLEHISHNVASHSVLAITNKVGIVNGRGGVPLWLGARKSLRPWCVCVCVCVCVVVAFMDVTACVVVGGRGGVCIYVG